MTLSLTQGSVAKTLIRLTSPSVLGLFAVISINLVDTYFISQIGMKELASVTFALPVVMFVMNGSVGLSIGSASVLSRALGRGELNRGASITTSALFLAVMILSIVMFLGLFYQELVFDFMGVAPELMPVLLTYMRIWFLGLPLLAIPMLSNSALTAHGDTKWPAIIMCSAALSNLILDPILIFGWFGVPKLGVAGAGIATVISYGVASLISLSLLLRRKLLQFVPFEKMKGIWKEIFRVAVPASATQMMIPLSNAGSLWILSELGASAIAAYGVVCRLESVALVMVIALSSSVGAFSGQNYGNGNIERLRSGLKVAYSFSFFWGLFLALISFLFAKNIALLFSSEEKVVFFIVKFLTMVPLTYGVLGFCFVASAFFNAIGSPLKATLITVLRHFVLYLPLAFLGMRLFGVMGVFYALFFVNLMAGSFAAFFSLYSLMRRKDPISLEIGS